jgi:acyl-coenzyme A thioesterase PaaI-like protein
VPPNEAVSCRAHCVKITRHVAFARAVAFVGDREDALVATASATFMIFGGDRSPMMRAHSSHEKVTGKGR